MISAGNTSVGASAAAMFKSVAPKALLRVAAGAFPHELELRRTDNISDRLPARVAKESEVIPHEHVADPHLAVCADVDRVWTIVSPLIASL